MRPFLPALAVSFSLLTAAPPASSEVFVATDQGVLVFSEPGDWRVDEPGGWQDGPIRRLGGPAAGFTAASAIAVDTVNAELFVVPADSEAAILVFDEQDEGDVPPRRAIRGPTTQLQPRIAPPAAIAVDTERDEILLANTGGAPAVLVFDRLADGDAAPIRAIEYGSSGIFAALGVFVDGVRDETYVGDQTGSVLVFDRDASGNVAPKRVIDTVEEVTVLRPILSVFLDGPAGELFVAPVTGYTGAGVAFDPWSDGPADPLRTQIPWHQRLDALVVTEEGLMVWTSETLMAAQPKQAAGTQIPFRDEAFLGSATYASGLTSSRALGGASSFFLPEPAEAVAAPVVLLTLVAMRRARRD